MCCRTCQGLPLFALTLFYFVMMNFWICMYYYKSIDETGLYASSSPIIADGIVEITESEYIKATTPTEQEIREEKERQLRKLMLELYPPEEV